ncbi:RidA family protein [Hirschia maritima]|uniref:RidA family protein n=1 Tax=Hirschia maritima TaxID=1121961 RepID=UPI00035FC753|nr:RidA family protein [Hirschia maritima]
MTNIQFHNPESVVSPLGLYSHTAKVAEGSELFYFSGQLGVARDGYCPSTIGERAEIVFANIVSLLEAHNMTASNIVKLTTFMVDGYSGADVRKARLKYLGDHRPASTAVYVSRLVDENWFVEIDVVAARAK